MVGEDVGHGDSTPGSRSDFDLPLCEHFPLEGSSTEHADVVDHASDQGTSRSTPRELEGPANGGEELSAKLAKQRSKLESSARTFESCPEASKADASHLFGLEFNAPAVRQWLLDFKEEQEDRRAEFLSEALAERGCLPRHLVEQASHEEVGRLQHLVNDLAKMRAELAAEHKKVGKERRGLQQREASLKSNEQTLMEVERSHFQLKDYPRPDFLAKSAGTMNVGVVGNSGVGKSLLINRLRGLSWSGEPGWAPVGIKETTLQVSMYTFPNERRVRLWDFPGAGTARFPLDGYIARFGLRYLDSVIVVTASRFTETEVALLQELRTFCVPHVLVRTKVDIDVQNNQEDNGFTMQQTLQEIRDRLRDQCQVGCYLVSLRDPEAYDFPDLLRDVFPCLGNQTLGDGWDDNWQLPVSLSPLVAGIQGTWTDGQCTYTVNGLQVHIESGGKAAVLALVDEGDKVWWQSRLWISKDAVSKCRVSGELRWTPGNLGSVRPLLWRWA